MKCPICAKPSEQGFRPFCSARCSDIDLARWLNGSYVIPGDPVEDGVDLSSVTPLKGREEG